MKRKLTEPNFDSYLLGNGLINIQYTEQKNKTLKQQIKSKDKMNTFQIKSTDDQQILKICSIPLLIRDKTMRFYPTIVRMISERK